MESLRDAKTDIEKKWDQWQKEREKHLRNWGEVPSCGQKRKRSENAEKSLTTGEI